MEQIYKKVGYSSDFENINIESILPKFSYEISDDVDHPNRTQVKPLTDNSGTLFWQKYPSGVTFARNFFRHNKDLCIHIADIIKGMQNQIPDSATDLDNLFKHLRINPVNVNLIRVSGIVQAHRDVTRNYSLSIGMDNSADYRTYTTHCPKIDEYNESMREYYTVGQNDVYMTAVKYVHGVIPISDEIKTIRYIFTYNIV
jgi:hypothetical protein